jgi:hypothetical protein
MSWLVVRSGLGWVEPWLGCWALGVAKEPSAERREIEGIAVARYFEGPAPRGERLSAEDSGTSEDGRRWLMVTSW